MFGGVCEYLVLPVIILQMCAGLCVGMCAFVSVCVCVIPSSSKNPVLFIVSTLLLMFAAKCFHLESLLKLPSW